MKIAIGTSWYHGISEEVFNRLCQSVGKFPQDKIHFYIYCDEAPENTNIEMLHRVIENNCIKNYTVIQGHTNNNVYYAKRKLLMNIKEKWCIIIDCDDSFNDDFINFMQNHQLEDEYQVYRFRTNIIGNHSMIDNGDKQRKENFIKGNHLCIWGKIYLTSALQSAYELLPKYKYKFMLGEENLVGNIILSLQYKDIPVTMINYTDEGLSSNTKITDLNRFYQLLTIIYILALEGKNKVFAMISSRLPFISEELQDEALKLLKRFAIKVTQLEDEFKKRLNNGELLPEIERDIFENTSFRFLPDSMLCNWLPDDK